VGEIVWLGRYPVKSMRGEDVTRVDLDGFGVAGDRRYALIDSQTGLVASAKNPHIWRNLLVMSARHDPYGRVTITCPDRTVIRVDDPDVDPVLTRALGRPVRLVAHRPDGASLERLTPPTEPGVGQITRGTLAAGTPGDTFVDFAAVHLVTTATLDALARAHPHGDMNPRRFRPNMVIRMREPVPFAENGWPARTITAGPQAVLQVIAPTPRCVIPTLAHGEDLPDDPHVLRTAARLNRVPVLDLGVRTCVGAYAAVQRGGQLSVGDLIRVAA
jgi:uncharacterized protein